MVAGDIIFHYHFGGLPDPKVAQVLEIATKIQMEIQQMSGTLTDLKAAQAATDAAIEEAVGAMNEGTAKIEELAAKITAAGTDPVALQAVVDDLTSHAATLTATTDKLQAAVAAQSTVVDATPDPVPSPPNPTPEPDPDAPPSAPPV